MGGAFQAQGRASTSLICSRNSKEASMLEQRVWGGDKGREMTSGEGWARRGVGNINSLETQRETETQEGFE